MLAPIAVTVKFEVTPFKVKLLKVSASPYWLKPFRVIGLVKLTLLRFAPEKLVLAAMLTVDGE